MKELAMQEYPVKVFDLTNLEGLSNLQIETHLELYAGYVRNTWTAMVPADGGSGRTGGSGSGRRGARARRRAAARSGLRWSSGVGSVQRSQKVCARSPTAGPRISSWRSCHGGRAPYRGFSSTGWASP